MKSNLILTFRLPGLTAISEPFSAIQHLRVARPCGDWKADQLRLQQVVDEVSDVFERDVICL